MQNSDNLIDEAQRIGSNSPYVMVSSSAEETSYHIVVERQPMCELSTFNFALIHLLGTYFIYDIAYPKAMHSLLLMIQHYIFGLKDTQRETPAVLAIVSSLKSMDSIP